MGSFDELAQKQFKKDAAGNDVYFPWGILGKGYVVPSRAHAEKLQNATKTLLALVAIFIAIPHLLKLHGEARGWFVCAGLIIVAASQLYLFLQVRKYPVSEEKIDLGSSSALARMSICLFIQLISVLGLVVGYYIAIKSQQPVDTVMAALIIPISVLAFILATRSLYKTIFKPR